MTQQDEGPGQPEDQGSHIEQRTPGGEQGTAQEEERHANPEEQDQGKEGLVPTQKPEPETMRLQEDGVPQPGEGGAPLQMALEPVDPTLSPLDHETCEPLARGATGTGSGSSPLQDAWEPLTNRCSPRTAV